MKSSPGKATQKRSYAKPVLRVYGNAAQLTHSENTHVRTYDGTDAGGGTPAKT